jgi:hypothetical protein
MRLWQPRTCKYNADAADAAIDDEARRMWMFDAIALPGRGCFRKLRAVEKLEQVGLASTAPLSPGIVARSVATKQSMLPARWNGLLRFARNNGIRSQ